MDFIKTTEQDSNYNHLEKMSISELLRNINDEDQTVPQAVKKSIPQIEKLVTASCEKIAIRWSVILYRLGNEWPVRHRRCFRMSSNLWGAT